MSLSSFRHFDSPLGPIQVLLNARGALVYLGFAEHEPRERMLMRLLPAAAAPEGAALEALRQQLLEYFAGRRRTFDFPLELQGTPFQRRVWAELQRIPFGRTFSYLDLARRLGDPKLTRAVGTANGANPVSILVPCHRVIGRDGTLTGYAGGLERKQELLALEKRGLGVEALEKPSNG